MKLFTLCKENSFHNKAVFFDWTSYVILFLVPAVFGYLWEIFLYLFCYHTFCNRGFTYGPWLTVYGLGGCFFYILLYRHTANKLFCFFTCAFIGSALELFVGLLTLYFLGYRYWDYSHLILNFEGYICFFSSLGFGICGMLWVCFLCPKLLTLWLSVGKYKKRNTFVLLLYLCYIFDFLYSLYNPNQGKGISYHAWTEVFLHHSISLFAV